ncbi:unnamed protein product [Rotaria sordida]|uniref:Uncharacterized protein n=1 Tax=Rotaria sordida TaxID=392033 RepID=A0A818J636_9BILA|nr:unnamed protein product [Rotaria sordida]
MNHSSRSNEPYPHGYVPFQLELGNGLLHSVNYKNLNRQQDKNDYHSKSIEITRNINTRINYLSLPEPRLQLVKHQQLLDFKNQIEQDFSIRFRYMNDNELNQIFSNINKNDTNRYIRSYHYLYQCALESTLKCVDINEEISQIKYLIIYKNEILPILIHNHKLAKQEKKILYNIVTKTWKKFDKRIQNEINVEYQLEQLKEEHQNLINMKIKQEQCQTFYLQLHNINNDVTHLKREIQQLTGYKRQLQDEIHEIKTRCSHNLLQLDFLKSNIVRTHTNELNNLQLERDSLITQTELIKYNLFEQTQQYDNILKNYRASLNNFRLTLIELEQQLKQQTDNELFHLQISNLFEDQTIDDDINKLILILENKIDEKKLINIQLQKTIDDFQENIVKQKQLLIKKEHYYKTMDHKDQQLNDNINIYRETYNQLKIERRTIERQLTLKLKQYSNDDRLHHTLIQNHDLLLTRKKLEQIRMNTLNEHLYPLIDENNQLKNQLEHLYRQYTEINPNNLRELRQKIIRLRQIHQTFIQHKLIYEYTKNNYQKIHEQLHLKTSRTTIRINNILKRIEQNNIDFKNNYEHIQILENKLSEEQDHYLQSKYLLTEMKNHSESYQTKQHLIQMQIQVTLNNTKHSQYRSKYFTEQLFIYHKDLVEQQKSLNKLREFHSVLKEQDEINLKKLSNIYIQFINHQNEYKIAEKSLQQINEDLIKYLKVRSILGRMVVRRINLCQLLYKKLARFDEYIHQREQNIQIISKCINSLKTQIRQTRDQNRKFIERKDKFQLEVVKVHIDKMLDHSHEKQKLLTKQIFQRRFYKKQSFNPLPSEEITYLKNKLYIIKNRFIKIICRGIICNLVLISIQQEFSNHFEYYTLKTRRENYINLNFIRTNLYQLMRQLKAKTAENNMLIDYQYYFQLIHTDTIQQLLQWKNFNSTDNF